MDNTNSFVNEFGGNTPDSGIDMSKFNIVDYILNNSEPGDIVWEPPNLASDPTVTLLPNNESDVSKGPLPGLRTSCKLEFQRRKALEDSQREKRALSSLQPPPQSTPVNLPQNTASGPPPVANIPKELLFVETRLENPTKYHLQQCVRNNITRYNLEAGGSGHLGLGGGRGGSVPPPGAAAASGESHIFGLRGLGVGAAPGSAPPNIFMPARLQSLNSSSVLNPSSINSSLGTSAASNCSDHDPMLTPDNDLSLSTLSEMKELMMEDGGSRSGRNSAGAISRNDSTGSRGQGQGQPDSPLHSPDTPGGDDNVRAAKDRQKKDNHNKIERRRRYLINDMITLQGQQLPKVNEPYYEKFGDVKQNKGAILQASVDYIQILKDENEAFRRKEEKTGQRLAAAEQEKKKLLLRIQELEQLCACNGISIPEESLTWRPQQLDSITSLMAEPLNIKQEPKLCEFMEDNSMVTGGIDPMLGPMDDLTSLEDVVMELS